jgi:hypothetical protein
MSTVGLNATPNFAPVFGTLASTNDAVTIALNGYQWATARVQLVTYVGGGFVVEMSIDGGTNWLSPAYLKRTDAVSANPTVIAPASLSGAVSTYDLPIPSNCTNVRVRCTSPGVSTWNLSGGALYAPGMPVQAVLYDQTSVAINGANGTVFDVSGWTGISLGGTAGVTGTIGLFEVDDNGNIMSYGFTCPVNTSPQFGWGVGSTYVLNANSFNRPDPLPRRISFVVASLAAPRIRLTARR